jgi:hypothetical protein
LFAQPSLAHIVPGLYLLQPPPPLQRPSVPQLFAPRSWQTLRESSAPAARLVQRPLEDGRAQLRQAPWQAFSQQTPSTQKFDAQSAFALQSWPGCLGPQLPMTQACPAWQSPSCLHGVLQAPLMQR